MANSNINFKIVEKIGVISEISSGIKKGWTKEINIVSWNNKKPKYDIREWSPDHTSMGRGITFTESEIKALGGIINGIVIKI